jgi:hypothetical protein
VLCWPQFVPHLVLVYISMFVVCCEASYMLIYVRLDIIRAVGSSDCLLRVEFTHKNLAFIYIHIC